MKLLLLFLLFFSSYSCGGIFDSLYNINLGKKTAAIKAYKQQDYEKALIYFHDLMNTDPYNPEYNYNVGDIFYKQQKYQDAQHAFFRAAEKAGALSLLQEQALFNAGNSSYQLAEWQQAVQAYQQVLKINENNQSARHNLELALYKLQEQLMKDQQKKDEDKVEKQENKNPQVDKQNSQQAEKDKNQSTQSNSDEQENNNNSDDGGQDHNLSEKKGNQEEKSLKNDQSEKQDGQNDFDNNEGRFDNSLNQDSRKEDGNNNYENEDSLTRDFHDGAESLDRNEENNQSNRDKNESDIKNSFEQLGNQELDKNEKDSQIDQSDNMNDQGDKKEAVPSYKKPDLKNQLKDEYESKASDDERLTDYYASVMKTLEDLEEKVQKHIIKNKVAMQGVGQNGKKGW